MTSASPCASAADAAALAAIHGVCFDEPWDEGVFSYMLALPSSMAVVERSQGEVVGFVLCRIAGEESEILSCAVRPDMRRRGIASRLLAMALDSLRTRGPDRVFLEVAEDAPAARALYGRSGFRPVGRRRRYYVRRAGAAVDAIIMRCDL